MDPVQGVIDWHERLLGEALAWREAHPDFRFNLRTTDTTGHDRLRQGYWFTGNDRYLFFAPFRPHDQNNKTRTIGFVVSFAPQGPPRSCYLEVVFGATQDATLRKIYQRIVSDLGPFDQVAKDKYQRNYSDKDPVVSFREFLSMDYPRLRDLIRDAGLEQAFLVSEPDFKHMLDRIEGLRPGQARSPVATTNGAPRAAATRTECRNLILYGPPGTGKTHWLRQKFDEYTDAPSVVDHDTWLQELLANYGWRPVIAAALADRGLPARVPEIRDHHWVRAKTKQRGRTSASIQATLWRYLQEHTPETITTVKVSARRPPFIFAKRESGEWELLPDWQELDEESAELARLLRAGPGGAPEPIRRYRVVTFHPSFSYEDFVRGIRPVVTSEDGTTQFRVVDGIFKQICDEAKANPTRRYALFIDEINRANLAKVFGELITLIEPDKRVGFDANGHLTQGMTIHLPGGEGAEVADPPFGVPANLDIYGTMNTADRSIALLDVALRRRFEFQEMEPDYTVLDQHIGPVHLGELLRRLNQRLEYLLDRDHRIGHAYLIRVETLADLRQTFRTQIIPLLQEYFFDDLARVAMVLAAGPSAPPLIAREWLSYSDLFSGMSADRVPAERAKYVVTADASWTEESFLGIYAPTLADADQEAPV